MDCKDAIYSNSVVDYIVADYIDGKSILERYQTDCYQFVDSNQAIIYEESETITSRTLFQYGYLALPACYGLMDQSALEATQVLKVRQQPYLNLYGQGILIGVIDTGIDWTHPAFIRADGKSRIVSIWDQTLREGIPPQEFLYGTEFTVDEINEALKNENPGTALPTRDENGHGTFLAGVAAGNIIREENFSGIAPNSELLIVKCKQAKNIYREFYRIPNEAECYQENDIMLAVSYLLRKARTMRRPIVICIGMGTNMGNHSGDSRLGVMLDRYNRIPGVCIVLPAGNEGNSRHHYLGAGEGEEYEEIDVNVEQNFLGFTMEMWGKTPGVFSIEVISPSGDTSGKVRLFALNIFEKTFVLENSKLEIIFSTIISEGTDQIIVVRLADSKPGIWKIRVYPESNLTRAFNIWLPIEAFLEQSTFFLRSNPDTTVCEPANAPFAITVTAYNVRTNALYLSAGRGYSAEGAIKPDVTAPGVDVYGPLPRGRYGTRTGTSVAAAITAGVSAILFQQSSQYEISGAAIKELLIRGAERKENIRYPNNEWGYGTVDAYSSILVWTNTS